MLLLLLVFLLKFPICVFTLCQFRLFLLNVPLKVSSNFPFTFSRAFFNWSISSLDHSNSDWTVCIFSSFRSRSICFSSSCFSSSFSWSSTRDNSSLSWEIASHGSFDSSSLEDCLMGFLERALLVLAALDSGKGYRLPQQFPPYWRQLGEERSKAGHWGVDSTSYYQWPLSTEHLVWRLPTKIPLVAVSFI